MDKFDRELVEEIFEVVDLEQTILQKMIQTLENYQSGSFTVPISPIKQLLAKIEHFDLKNSPHKASKRIAKLARFLYTVLSDLKFLVKETENTPNKSTVLKEIDELLSRSKKILDSFYSYYYYLPEPRYIERWYYGYRNHYKYLPYYDYEYYYNKYYPNKRQYLDTTESIWHNVIHGSDDRDENTLLVPKAFQGNQAEYDEYCLWKARKELELMRENRSKSPLELQRESDKTLDVADLIIKSYKKVRQ
jgi:hypothetical protein